MDLSTLYLNSLTVAPDFISCGGVKLFIDVNDGSTEVATQVWAQTSVNDLKANIETQLAGLNGVTPDSIKFLDATSSVQTQFTALDDKIVGLTSVVTVDVAQFQAAILDIQIKQAFISDKLRVLFQQLYRQDIFAVVPPATV
jgi:hypothetical protein